MPRMMTADVEFVDADFLQHFKITRRVILSKWEILKLKRCYITTVKVNFLHLIRQI